MKDIETLLNKYFEGETTCEEERRLRRFFAEGLVPEHLEVYRPMFAFFEAEQEELTEVSGQCNAGEMPELAIFEKKTKTVRKYLTYRHCRHPPAVSWHSLQCLPPSEDLRSHPHKYGSFRYLFRLQESCCYLLLL